MRPLKFRAWHPSANGEGLGAMFFVGDSFGTTHPLDCCKYALEGQPVELMQFTGLLDSQGVEIYEGDIIVSRDVSASGRRRVFMPRAVRWNADMCEFNFSRPSALGAEIQVIGNIHENPELLK